jgi:hypothetical protein
MDYPTSGMKRKKAETWNLRSSIFHTACITDNSAEAVLLCDTAE